MKIIKLHFKNINSLAGEWSINFNDPQFANNSIFAITGETGSGKTSILDAICYALYEQTPRQTKLESKKSASMINGNNNDIMTRDTAECFAEVAFETPKGIYHVRTEQQRAHKRIDGELQPSKRELFDEKGIIHTKSKSDVNAKVIELTGLDFPQFTKAMMLAQGCFNAFLTSNIDERTKILEKLSNTSIYRRISEQIGHRLSTEKLTLDSLKNQVGSMAFLSEEDRKKLEMDTGLLKIDLESMGKQIDELQKSKSWRAELDKQIILCQNILHKKTQLDAQIEAFFPNRQKLKNAQNADKLSSDYQHLCELRKNSTEIEKQFTDITKEIEQLSIQLQNVSIQAEKANEEYQNAHNTYTSKKPDINQMRTLDQELNKTATALNDKNQNLYQANENIKSLQAKLDQIQAQSSDNDQQLAHIAEQIDKIPNAKTLSENLAAIEISLKPLEDEKIEGTKYRDRFNNSLKELKKSNQILEAKTKLFNQARADFSDTQTAHENLQSALDARLNGKSLEDFEVQVEAWKSTRNSYQAVHKFEAERAKLIEGKPCPLCGSTHHPGLDISQIDEQILMFNQQIDEYQNIIKDIKNIDKSLQQAAMNCQRAQLNLNNAEKDAQIAQSNCEHAKAIHDNNEAELNHKRQYFTELRASLQDKLATYGIHDQIADDGSSLLDTLRAQCQQYRQLETAKSNAEKERIRLTTDLSTEKTKLDERNIVLNALKTEIQALEHQHEMTRQQRSQYPNQTADEYEQSLSNRLDIANKKLNAVKEEHAILEKSSANKSGERTTLANNIDMIKLKLEDAEAAFKSKLSAIDFADEGEFLRSKLNHEETNELNIKAQKLDNQFIELNTLYQDAKAQCDELTAQNLTAQSLDELNKNLNDITSKRDDINRQIGDNQRRINDDNDNRIKFSELNHQLEQQQKVWERWNTLDRLIGCKNNSKFNKFAQGLTFQKLCQLANDYLCKFNPRYSLISNKDIIDTASPDETASSDAADRMADTSQKSGSAASIDYDSGLEFYIIDNYQGSIKRPISTLSGGESFLVSLSLALGMAKMASKNIPIDSLFIDEGFGSLDANTMGTVMGQISSIMQDSGKQVGIISHVDAIKSIGTQIQIYKTGGGHSKIKGPGVEQLASNNSTKEVKKTRTRKKRSDQDNP